MQNNRLVFYDSPLSPCARRVRVTLAAKQISHAVEYVDISKAEQKRPAYKAINPYGKVPAMTVDGRPLWESNIMTQYLDEAFACPALYPSDPLDYARVREWQAFEIRFAQTFFMLMYHRLAGTVLRVQKRSLERFVADIKKQSNDPAFIEFNKKAFLGNLLSSTEEAHHEQLLLDGIGKIEDALQDGRAYLIGAHFSQADISVFPRMRMLVYLGVVVDKTRYPNTSRWLTRVARQPSMSASMTANEQMMANPLMLRMLRWARYPSLKPADEQSLAERVGLRLMHHLLALDALAIERLVVGLKKRLSKSRVDQSGISAPQRPVNMSSPTLTLAYNPASGEGQAASEILRWLGIDAATETNHEASPSLRLDSEITVCGLPTVVDVLYRTVPQAEKGFPRDAYLRARARIWVGGDKEGETKYLQQALSSDVCPVEVMAAAQSFAIQQIKQVDSALADNDWLLGQGDDAFGFADIASARRIQYYNAGLGGELLSEYPRVRQWLAGVQQRLGNRKQHNSSAA